MNQKDIIKKTDDYKIINNMKMPPSLIPNNNNSKNFEKTNDKRYDYLMNENLKIQYQNMNNNNINNNNIY